MDDYQYSMFFNNLKSNNFIDPLSDSSIIPGRLWLNSDLRYGECNNFSGANFRANRRPKFQGLAFSAILLSQLEASRKRR